MALEQFIQDYFINPVVEHTGYNIVNTFFYAIIAMIAAFLIYKRFKKYFTKELILYTIPFILLGSTVRVITDATESGIDWTDYPMKWLFKPVLDSGIYNYSFLTATPGIYIIIGILTLFSLYLSVKLKKPKLYPAIGLVLLIPHSIIVLSMIKDFTFLLIILALSLFLIVISNIILLRFKLKGTIPTFVVSAHIIDGVSSFTAIEIFNRISPQCIENGICYFGQHVVERFFSELMVYGTIIYLIIKILFAIFACYIVEKETDNENEKYFLYLVLIIFGLAPGIRNMLRITLGV